MQRTGERIEEALLEIDALDEARCSSTWRRSTRLASSRPRSSPRPTSTGITLDKVPKKLAERDGVFPVLYDAKASALSVVTPDPDNAPALHDVQLASGVKEVRAFVGGPRAVRAAISKAYNGDIHAFAVLDRSAHQQFTQHARTSTSAIW